MREYRAPTEEILFVMNELAGADELASLPGFEDATADLVQAVLDEAAKFSAGVLAPLNHSGDEQGVKIAADKIQLAEGFTDAYQQYVASAWLSLAQNPEYGGKGLPFLLHTATTEMWNSANMAFTLCPMLTAGAIEAIEAHASSDLKQQFLPKMISGEWSGTMNLTEPQAGSDLSAVNSKAIPNDDHYLIAGQKIFITWGDHEMTENIVHLVLARLPDAPPGIKGISLFLVPKYLLNEDGSLGERNDVKAVSLEHKLGIHASPTCAMSFGDNDGAKGYLIGEENKGLACMFTMMNHARLEVGLEGVSLSERAYQQAVEYASERIQGADPDTKARVAILKHTDVKRMLLIMRAQTEASRAVTYLAAATYDRARKSTDEEQGSKLQARLDLLTPIVKAWSTELTQEVTSLGVQVHGGMGYIEETGAAQYLRDARIITIYEGTTGIQAADLMGRKLLRDRGLAFKSLLDEIGVLTDSLSASDAKPLNDMGVQLERARNDAQKAAEKILVATIDNIQFSNAVAFDFLMLVGTLLGGWQMALAALIAHERLSNGAKQTRFYNSKIITAKFYMEYLLPRIKAYSHPIYSGADSLVSLDSSYQWPSH